MFVYLCIIPGMKEQMPRFMKSGKLGQSFLAFLCDKVVQYDGALVDPYFFDAQFFTVKHPHFALGKNSHAKNRSLRVIIENILIVKIRFKIDDVSASIEDILTISDYDL